MYCEDILLWRLLYAYRLKQTWVMYFQWPRNSIRGLTNVISGHFRFISGGISAEKTFLGYFYNKRFVFEIQGESLKAIFELSFSFPPLSVFQRILAVYWQLVPWLLKSVYIGHYFYLPRPSFPWVQADSALFRNFQKFWGIISFRGHLHFYDLSILKFASLQNFYQIDLGL